MLTIETVPYRGWKNNIRLANGQVELIVTQEVGPRIIRFGFIGQENILGEFSEQLGGCGEKEWLIRGGHRLWLAPEEKPKTYELDNLPVAIRKITAGGIRVVQPPGKLAQVEKTLEIALAERRNQVTIRHHLTNRGRKPITLAPWALTVMARCGTAIIPLPEKIPHTARLTSNQNWTLWGYTDFSDPRWTFLSRYLLFRHDPKRGPNKLGIAHREGWVAYWLKGTLFVKWFAFKEGVTYPDQGVNFETFANERILELESLGPLVALRHGQTTTHTETWALHRAVPECRNETAIEKYVHPCAAHFRR
ncbi:MAG: hypothetical protein HYV35_07155 [Lentisphaerae bacterium]|nr:hypothetical protein [Lentisphaerota bacterium]